MAIQTQRNNKENIKLKKKNKKTAKNYEGGGGVKGIKFDKRLAFRSVFFFILSVNENGNYEGKKEENVQPPL